MVALGRNDVFVPVFLLDSFLQLLGFGDTLGLLHAILADDDLLTALAQDASATFFVVDPRIRITRFEVSLVATDDPVAQVLAAVLNARVPPDDLKLQP